MALGIGYSAARVSLNKRGVSCKAGSRVREEIDSACLAGHRAVSGLRDGAQRGSNGKVMGGRAESGPAHLACRRLDLELPWHYGRNRHSCDELSRGIGRATRPIPVAAASSVHDIAASPPFSKYTEATSYSSSRRMRHGHSILYRSRSVPVAIADHRASEMACPPSVTPASAQLGPASVQLRPNARVMCSLLLASVCFALCHHVF